MSANCLKTKLKGIVSNVNILPLGGFAIEVAAGDGFKFQLYSSGQYELHLIGDAYFMDASTMSGYYNTDADDSRDIESSGNHDFAISPGSARLVIVDKTYSITKLSAGNSRLTIEDVDVLRFRSNLGVIALSNTEIHGNVEKLGILENLTNIQLNSATLDSKYNILAFASCYNIIEFLTGTFAMGTLENFVEQQSPHRANNDSISLANFASDVTFHGTKNNVNKRFTITFNGSGGASVSFNNNVVGTYNGSAWTYV